jgi:NADH-quinone oxidoreductase subunit J
MDRAAIIFYILAFVMIASSLLAVTTRRILRAAVYLLFALGGTAALYFMIGYNFLAAVQLIVYVGGIVVLIIFSILLTAHINEKLQQPDLLKIIFTAVIVVVGAGLTYYVLQQQSFTAQSPTGLTANVETIGDKLLNYGSGGYVLPFEVISILLLAAMVGAIVIAKRNKVSNND